MKRSTSLIVASSILFFSACTNENSSTVASQDDEQSSTSHSDGSKDQPANEGGSRAEGIKEESSRVSQDTSHTNLSISKDSAGFINRSGKNSIDTNGFKVTSKKVKVDVKTRQ